MARLLRRGRRGYRKITGFVKNNKKLLKAGGELIKFGAGFVPGGAAAIQTLETGVDQIKSGLVKYKDRLPDLTGVAPGVSLKDNLKRRAGAAVSQQATRLGQKYKIPRIDRASRNGIGATAGAVFGVPRGVQESFQTVGQAANFGFQRKRQRKRR